MYRQRDINRTSKHHRNEIYSIDPFELLKSQKNYLLEDGYANDKNVINMIDEMGNTLYHAAARLGRSDTIQWLHGKNKDVNELNNTGYTALHLACEKGYLHCVIALRMQGADLNMRTYPDQKSAMHLAARGGHWPIIHLLVRAGCSLTAEDDKGLTPLDHAVEQGHDRAVEVLAHYLNIPKPQLTRIPSELQRSTTKVLKAEELKKKRETFVEIIETRKPDQTFLDALRDASEFGEANDKEGQKEKEDLVQLSKTGNNN